MKKLLAALLCILLLVPACAAPAEEAGISAASILVRTDPAVFSPVTGHDLAAVREYVITELKSRPEWKETKIPAGEWAVGTDLPAGTYAFRHTDTRYSTTIRFTHMAGHSKKEASFLILAGEEVGKAELPDSTVLRLDNPVILAPPSFAAVSVRAAEKDTAYSMAPLGDISEDDLLRLQRELLELIVRSPDCESVLLPAGIWTVGKDIPAGPWTVRSGEQGGSLRHYKDAVTYGDSWHAFLGSGDAPLQILLKDGWKVEITGPFTFVPDRNQ